MLKMLCITWRYWHLIVFFMWLSFKFQLPAAPNGHVILALKDLGKGKIYTRQTTKAQSRVDIKFFSLLTFRARRGCMANTSPWPLYHWNRPSTIWIGGLEGPRARLDGCISTKCALYQMINKNLKSKFNSWRVLVAVYCTSNYLVSGICKSNSPKKVKIILFLDCFCCHSRVAVCVGIYWNVLSLWIADTKAWNWICAYTTSHHSMETVPSTVMKCFWGE